MSPTADRRLREQLWRPYVEDVALACLDRWPHEDTALVVAIGLRETWLGTCVGYAPKGPNGVGDGGHGRGLFQIDDRGPFAYLVPPAGADWPAYIQAQCACVVLARAREELADFRGALSGWGWDQAVAARYNAALENVRWALRNGLDPDRVTTGKDYGRDVLSLRDGLRRLYPTTFPPAAGPAAPVA